MQAPRGTCGVANEAIIASAPRCPAASGPPERLQKPATSGITSRPRISSEAMARSSGRETIRCWIPAWASSRHASTARSQASAPGDVLQPAQRRPLDGLIRAADRLAVPLEDIQLVEDGLRPVVGEQVAGVGVLRHQTQRLRLAAAADQDGRMRLRERLRAAEWFFQPVVATPDRRHVAGPHSMRNAQRFFQLFETVPERREGHPQSQGFALKPRRAEFPDRRARRTGHQAL